MGVCDGDPEEAETRPCSAPAHLLSSCVLKIVVDVHCSSCHDMTLELTPGVAVGCCSQL